MSHLTFASFLCLLLVMAGPLLMTAQAPDTSNLGLVGDRFKPLTFDKMTPAQKTMTTNLLTGERRGMGGPFNVLLRSPEMGDAAQKLGHRSGSIHRCRRN